MGLHPRKRPILGFVSKHTVLFRTAVQFLIPGTRITAIISTTLCVPRNVSGVFGIWVSTDFSLTHIAQTVTVTVKQPIPAEQDRAGFPPDNPVPVFMAQSLATLWIPLPSLPG